MPQLAISCTDEPMYQWWTDRQSCTCASHLASLIMHDVVLFHYFLLDLVCLMTPSILKNDNIIEIATSAGGAALVLLIAVTILCICTCIGRCKKRANGGGYVPMLQQVMCALLQK